MIHTVFYGTFQAPGYYIFKEWTALPTMSQKAQNLMPPKEDKSKPNPQHALTPIFITYYFVLYGRMVLCTADTDSQV